MKIDIGIIENVLNNRAMPEEAKRVVEWFAEEEGQEFLSQYMAKEQKELTEEKAMSWLDHSVPEQHMKMRIFNQLRQSKKKKWRRRLLTAAVVVPFLFLGVSVIFLAGRSGIFTETKYVEVSVPYGEHMQVMLQDGTIVLLNSGTKLKYPQRFALFNRTVQLSGEGYFKVAKMKSAPFVVDVEGMKVTVTGTKFNVKAYSDDRNVWVALEEGGVRLEDNKSFAHSLAPGEQVEYNRKSGKYRVERMEDFEDIVAWKNHGLSFYLTPLGEILKVLERQYDAHFTVEDSTLLDSRFTLFTTKVNVDEVLEDLSTVSHITFVKQKKGIYEVILKE